MMFKVGKNIIFLYAIGVIVFCFMLFWVFTKINFFGLIKEIRKINNFSIIMSITTANAFLVSLYAKRLHCLLPKNSYQQALMITSIGQIANSVFPFRFGEVIRITLSSKIFNLPWVKSGIIIAIERFVDLIVIIGLFCAAICIGSHYFKVNVFYYKVSFFIFIFFICLMSIFFLFKKNKVNSIIEKFKLVFHLFKINCNRGKFLFLTVLIWIFTISIFYLFFLLSGIQSYSLLDALNMVIITSLAIAIPNVSATLGTFEAGIVAYMTTQFKYPFEQALALAIILHCSSMAPQLLFLSLNVIYKQWIKFKRN